jgi:hypothetical protein
MKQYDPKHRQRPQALHVGATVLAGPRCHPGIVPGQGFSALSPDRVAPSPRSGLNTVARDVEDLVPGFGSCRVTPVWDTVPRTGNRPERRAPQEVMCRWSSSLGVPRRCIPAPGSACASRRSTSRSERVSAPPWPSGPGTRRPTTSFRRRQRPTGPLPPPPPLLPCPSGRLSPSHDPSLKNVAARAAERNSS